MNQSLNKKERLRSKKLTEQLFGNGKSFFIYPFKVVFMEVNMEGNYPAQILISVSKRNFKQAVKRNRIKRLVRESYRKNKEKLYLRRPDCQRKLLIGLIYTAKTILSQAEIESKIILILQRLIEQDEQAAG